MLPPYENILSENVSIASKRCESERVLLYSMFLPINYKIFQSSVLDLSLSRGVSGFIYETELRVFHLFLNRFPIFHCIKTVPFFASSKRTCPTLFYNCHNHETSAIRQPAHVHVYDSVLRKCLPAFIITRLVKYVMSWGDRRRPLIYTPGCFIAVCNWIKRQYFRGYLRGQAIATRLRRLAGRGQYVAKINQFIAMRHCLWLMGWRGEGWWFAILAWGGSGEDLGAIKLNGFSRRCSQFYNIKFSINGFIESAP